VILFATLLTAAAMGQPPAWIQRADIPPPIVAWRLADVLGTPIVEGIAVDRDVNTLEVNVVDSRFNPPRVVKQGAVPGKKVAWLKAGKRDHLLRNEIEVRTDKGTYLLRVAKAFKLQLVRHS
jgi:hypothetical protein